MIRRASIVGSLVLWMLAISAFSAAAASAEERAYACEPATVGVTFSDAHCVTAGTPTHGFKHVLLTSPTSITVTNGKTASGTTAAAKSIFKGKLASVAVEIACSTVSGSGELTNGPASVSGTATLKYSGCTVLTPSSCVIPGGLITTNKLKLSTVGTLGTHELKVEPNSGTELAPIRLENCVPGPPTATYPFSGRLVASLSGATATTTHAGTTSQATLNWGGMVAGLEGALTLSVASSGSAVSFT